MQRVLPSYKFKSFPILTDEESLEVFALRKKKYVRQWMFDQEDFSYSTHKVFINNLRESTSKRYYYVSRNDKFVGVYSIVNISDFEGQGGFYIQRQAALNGLTVEFLYNCLDFIFRERSISKIYGYQDIKNRGAYSLNKLFGFYDLEEEEPVEIKKKFYKFGSVSAAQWKDKKDSSLILKYLEIGSRVP